MNVSKVVDAAFQFRDSNPNATDEEVKLHVCMCLLMELKRLNADEFLPYFRSMDLKKAERQVVVNLSFPWAVTFSNFLGNTQDLDS